MKNSNLNKAANTTGNRGERSCSLTSFLTWLFVFAFLLNWIWEITQVPGYETMAGFSRFEKIYIITRATFVDGTIILGIYGIGAVVMRQARWAMDGGWACYLVFALLGSAAATIIERIALSFDFWRYNEQMPIVPFLDVGLYPFLQLTLLAPVALRLAVWRSGKTLR